ncbi:MAG: hypothetical protein AAGC72_01700 [Planctomycetota bacterium]
MLDWLFLDMDNYFASVEQQARPALRGRPVGVLPVMSEGTCCIAASAQAKRRGVKTGTLVREARRLCPEIRFIEARPAYYVEVHNQIKEAVEKVAPIDKVWSIDEVAVKLLGQERQPATALEMGRRVKQAIAEAVGECLTCSVGLAPTRLLAKVACELDKPDGLLTLPLNMLPSAIEQLKLTDLPGINVGVQARLNRNGVCTVGALWALTAQQAQDAWGSIEGRRYWMSLHGQEPALRPEHRRVFTHAHVLAPELRTEDGAHSVMTRLLHKAAARLRCHGYITQSMSAAIRYENDGHWRDGIDLPACQDTVTVIEHFERIWRRKRVSGTPKKVSITLGGLEPVACATGRLFDAIDARHALGDVIDTINRKFGNHSVYLGGMHHIANKEMHDKIAFGRVPDEAAAM